jgi:hypothetical protein
MATVTWPDTRRDDPPTDHLYRSATWLLGRHPQLATLAERVPGVVNLDDDGPDIDLDALSDALVEHDAGTAAWTQYERRRPAPRDDSAYDAWVQAGPGTSPAATAVGQMSGSERTRLRLLAAFSSTRVPLRVADFGSLDDAGRRLLADWCQAAQAA